MDELVSEFIAETREGIEALDSELVRFEQRPNDPETLGGVFRLIHTIKGTCGFLGLGRLQSVAHAAENVLGGFRDGTLPVSPAAVSAVLDTVDLIRSILEDLAITGREPAGDDAVLISRLEAVVLQTQPLALASTPDERLTPLPRSDTRSLIMRLGNDATLDAAAEMALPRIRSFAGYARSDVDQLQAILRDTLCDVARQPLIDSQFSTLIADIATLPPTPATIVAVFDAVADSLRALDIPQDAIEDLRDRVLPAPAAAVNAHRPPLTSQLVEDLAEPPPPAFAERPTKVVEPGGPHPGQEETLASGAKNGDRGENQGPAQTIRVSVDALEHLMTVVSELVLIRNQLIQTLRLEPESPFAAPLNRLNQVTSELQEGVMTTRMQPISGAWAKLPRLVRDLSQELGKSIELTLLGQDTELDRQVLELIKDPLTHMIRNAADHGLEMADVRIKAGKSATGRISLQARHEGGAIVIEVSDDGRGLSAEKIRAKALATGLLTAAQVENLTEAEARHLIFMPGFSTASQITAISGRGVGMDVVRTNIEKIGGAIELSSQEGSGTRFTIRIPLTLTIVSALIVECCGERFAMPQSSVVELVSASGASGRNIEYIDGLAVLRLRDRLLPLVSLQSLLGLEQAGDRTAAETCIAVARVGAFTFGVIVDRVFDTEEIVVKPVATVLRHIKLYSGATIMGDGSVILILDFKGISAETGAGQSSSSLHEHAVETSDKAEQAKSAILLFRATDNAIKAAPLSNVSRIEEVSAQQIERINSRTVVQYRGKLMPIVGADAGPAVAWEDGALRPMLVFNQDEQAVGLLVHEIVDIVESALAIDLKAVGSSTKGSLIIDGAAAELIDVNYYRRCALDGYAPSDAPQPTPAAARRRLLIIDQSPFSQILLNPLLSQAGYDVTIAADPKSVQTLYDQGALFDLIMVDTPNAQEAKDFAEVLRNIENWHQTPLLSLSMHKRPVLNAPTLGGAILLDAVSNVFDQRQGAA